jgi:hypothetical protein
MPPYRIRTIREGGARTAQRGKVAVMQRPGFDATSIAKPTIAELKEIARETFGPRARRR